ncbi:hypothetical protein CTEN210_17219 [Chaetoceros tenuissimus]|uniref:EDRF1 N-terminal domain-containing protein n=1 Tax=Chaetoceros tenuissimus TaxID=426638 RepID=A0AAD3DAC6_9STRA|nr:hypothetical protein CTEN210_17219 [Chaetoceros tenuissimus]
MKESGGKIKIEKSIEGSDTNAIASQATNVITFDYPNAYQNFSNRSSNETRGEGDRSARNGQKLDFIGTSTAIKDIFGLPYSADVGVAVAIHNIGNGTLLIDGAVVPDNNEEQTKQKIRNISKRRKRPRGRSNNGTESIDRIHPSLSVTDEHAVDLLSQNNKALTIQNEEDLLKYVSEMGKSQTKYLALTQETKQDNEDDSLVQKHSTECNSEKSEMIHSKLNEILIPPDSYTNDLVSPDSEIDKNDNVYTKWKFQDYNMLVGSDAIVLKSSNGSEDSNGPNAASKMDAGNKTKAENSSLALRIVDAEDLRSKLDQRQKQKSYADVAGAPDTTNAESKKDHTTKNEQAIIPYPDFANVSINSCVLPSSEFQYKLHEHGFFAQQWNPTKDLSLGTNTTISQGAPSSSPVCMVLDAYLDNLIENVPQLALCLQEKGLIQAVKLFDTKELPTLKATDLLLGHNAKRNDTTQPAFASKPLFSPEVVESNASMMLEFLKTNCSKENSTYLLKRNAGETTVQLLDVTSLSRQRHKKWIHWLAMINMRFAMRLDKVINDIKDSSDSSVVSREYRQKKRALLENALELLEELADMEGRKHETICCSIYEQLADSYLDAHEGTSSTKDDSDNVVECSFLQSASTEPQIYDKVGNDNLSKASDYLKDAVKVLHPCLDDAFYKYDCDKDDDFLLETIEAFAMQIYGVYHKLINVSMSLTESHLMKYKSSSVMQSLRLSARVIADASKLLLRISDLSDSQNSIFGHDRRDFIESISYQYSLSIENCGNFARSFAADEAWRERGHASGEDVICLLRDVEILSCHTDELLRLSSSTGDELQIPQSLVEKTNGILNLDYLSGVIPLSENGVLVNNHQSVQAGNKYLSTQKHLKKERRRVLVASAIKYSEAAFCFSTYVTESQTKHEKLWRLMMQRCGDAYNEIGKLLLETLNSIISSNKKSEALVPLLLSAEFWFKEGLEYFTKCSDVRNIAFLRANLSTCCKQRASISQFRMTFPERNETFDKNIDSHFEKCLNDAAKHLELAHVALDQRDSSNPQTWDLVSLELAATYLLIGVRRRQSLFGDNASASNTNPASEGCERAIVRPLELAKDIYGSLGIKEKVAATKYQLALYYSKVWTCKRSESYTRDKLSKAFQNLADAHKYYFENLKTNETSLICLILDLSSLYSIASASYEWQEKALLCCLDTLPAFSSTYCKHSSNAPTKENWEAQMRLLNDRMVDRVMSLLVSLVKIEKAQNSSSKKYQDIYREAVSLKLSWSLKSENGSSNNFQVFDLLSIVKSGHEKTLQEQSQ